MYLAVVLDAFSRIVLGWSIADHIRAELVVDALQMALWRRRPATGQTVHHSDHGAQGGIKGSSQHLDGGGVVDDDARASAGGAVVSGAGPVAGSANGGVAAGPCAVLGGDPRGVTTEDAALEIGVSSAVGTRWFRHAGGVNPTLAADRVGPLLVVR